MIDVDRGYVSNLRDAEGNVIVAQPNAGVLTRFAPGGISVHMYWGEPGVYYGDHGLELPEQMGKAAGFDTEKYKRERLKREALGKATVAIDLEYATMSVREVELERDAYRLVHVGEGRYNIEYEDGTLMNPQPLTKDIALRVFEQLSPAPLPPEKAKK